MLKNYRIARQKSKAGEQDKNIRYIEWNKSCTIFDVRACVPEKGEYPAIHSVPVKPNLLSNQVNCKRLINIVMLDVWVPGLFSLSGNLSIFVVLHKKRHFPLTYTTYHISYIMLRTVWQKTWLKFYLPGKDLWNLLEVRSTDPTHNLQRNPLDSRSPLRCMWWSEPTLQISVYHKKRVA